MKCVRRQIVGALIVSVSVGCSGAASTTASPTAPVAVALHVGPSSNVGTSVALVAGTDIAFIAERTTADSVRLGVAPGATWTSSNLQIATVNALGVVHATGVPGVALITAQASDAGRQLQGSIAVTVVVLVSGLRR